MLNSFPIYARVGALPDSVRPNAGEVLENAATCDLNIVYSCWNNTGDDANALLLSRCHKDSMHQMAALQRMLHYLEPSKEGTLEGTLKALEILLCDLCYYLDLHPHDATTTIQCSSSLVKDVLTCNLAQNDQLANHAIKLLCLFVFGSIQSRLGEHKTLHIECTSENECFAFMMSLYDNAEPLLAEWIIYDSSDTQFPEKLEQKMTDSNDRRFLFILFDELQINLSRQPGSDTLPTSNACMIELCFENARPSLNIVTIGTDYCGSTKLFTYKLTGEASIEERSHYKDDLILKAIIHGFKTVKMSRHIKVFCIPCRSSIWYFTFTKTTTEDNSTVKKKSVKQLCRLAAKGKFQELIVLPAVSINERHVDFLNRTPLLCAAAAATFSSFGKASEGHTNCAICLICCGADPNVADEEGWTAVHSAVMSSNNDLLEFLLSIKDINVNCSSKDGWTPLMIAANADNAEAARLLLSEASSTFEENSEEVKRVESICTNMGSSDVMEVIEKWRNGQYLPCPDYKLRFHLLHKVEENLIKKNSEISIAVQSVANAALYLSSTDSASIISRIIGVISDPELQTMCLISAYLETSKMNQWIEIKDILLRNLQCQDEQKSSSNIRSKVRASWLNIALSRGISDGHVHLAEAMIPHVSNLNHQDSDGRTALMLAADIGHEHLVQNLLNHKASITVKDNQGQTALFRACQSGHVEVVRMLIDSGADVSHKDYTGRTCQELATKPVRHLLLLHLQQDTHLLRKVETDKRRLQEVAERLRRASEEERSNSNTFFDEFIKRHQREFEQMEESLSRISEEERRKNPPFLEKWDTVRLLGIGAFGNVHEVLTDKGIKCAAKTIRLPFQQGKIERAVEKRIDAEKNLCKLIHRNIVSFLWISQQDANAVVFMEFLDGVTLEKLIGGKALDEDKIVGFGTQICSALRYMHSQEPPVIHRNVNCNNIMVLKDSSHIKLIDFGLSLQLQYGTHYSGSSATPKGTLYFMAPELFGSEESDNVCYSQESDIWAFGCTIYQMVTGTYPHSNCNNPLSMALKVMKNGAPALPDSCSKNLRNFYNCCIARDRKKRKSAADLLSHEFLTSDRDVDAVGELKSGSGDSVKTLLKKEFGAIATFNIPMDLDLTPPFLMAWDTVRLLGRGTFGDVHEVVTDKGIKCAAKIYRHFGQFDKLEKLVNAEKNLCNLIHPNIVRVLWISQSIQNVIVFMELLDGVTVREFLDGKALNENTISTFAIQICKALHYIHSRNVIHRDINCSNIMVLTDTHRVKLIDFGLSIKLQRLSYPAVKTMSPKGALHFIAPELLGSEFSGGACYSTGSDIWAFGCTVYEMATATVPYPECRNLLSMALKLEAKGAPALPDSCSELLKSFYNCCVERDRSKRMPATELLTHPFFTGQMGKGSIK